MRIHIVQRGDTVAAIARRYGVSAARILSDNGLTANAALVVGQALIITLPAAVYTVQRGDTLSGIAAAYGTTLSRLQQNNPELALSTAIYPGQTLTIRFQGGTRGSLTNLGYAYPHVERDTLRRALPFLTYLAVFSYGLRESGALIAPADTELISLAYQYSTAPVLVLTSLSEDGSFSSQRVSRLLNDRDFQERVLDNVMAAIRDKGYLGLDIDMEYIPPRDGPAYLDFLRNAQNRLAEYGLPLSVALAPKTYADQPGLLYEAHNYPAIGAIARRVLLMTYEWGYTYGPPMAVAPLPQVRDVAAYAVGEIPAEKILLGIPNYGYDWTLPYEQGSSRAVNLGNHQAVRLAARYGADIRYDDTAQAPWFSYYRQGREHRVWFEDVRSILAKLELLEELGLRGLGYWNVMRPFAQNWALLSARYDIRRVI